MGAPLGSGIGYYSRRYECKPCNDKDVEIKHLQNELRVARDKIDKFIDGESGGELATPKPELKR